MIKPVKKHGINRDLSQVVTVAVKIILVALTPLIQMPLQCASVTRLRALDFLPIIGSVFLRAVCQHMRHGFFKLR